MSRTARWLAISAVTVVTVVLAVVFTSRFGSDPSLSPSPLVGKPAPAITLSGIEGSGPITLEQFRGDIVVVNFWAPWCVPCRDEHALLVAAARDYAADGVTVLGVAYESEERSVIAFLDELGRAYPVGMDDRSRAAIGFGVRGVPETFFVDRDGTVVAKVSGAVDAAILRTTIEAMLTG